MLIGYDGLVGHLVITSFLRFWSALLFRYFSFLSLLVNVLLLVISICFAISIAHFACHRGYRHFIIALLVNSLAHFLLRYFSLSIFTFNCSSLLLIACFPFRFAVHWFIAVVHFRVPHSQFQAPIELVRFHRS